MFAEFYEEDLKNYNNDLELMTAGVIAKTSNLIIDHVKAASDNNLTLEDVCHIADTLNLILSSLDRKKTEIGRTEKLLEEERAKNKAREENAEVNDDNHE